MVPPDVYRLWERQRELARAKERERRVSALLEAAAHRLLRTALRLREAERMRTP